MAGDLSKTEMVEGQLAKEREAAETYKKQAETRITNLQRNLSAAEAKAEMVQKEFMTAFGTLPDPKSSAASETTSDGVDPKEASRKIRVLEEKITQAEAEARKKAREDSYKIAELEFRLAEAADVEKERDALATEVKAKDEALGDRQRELAQAQADLSSRQTTLAETQAKLDQVQAEAAASKAKVTETQSAMEATQKELAGARDDVAAAKAELARVEKELAEAKATLAAGQSEVESLKKSLAKTEDEFQKLQAKWREAEAEWQRQSASAPPNESAE